MNTTKRKVPVDIDSNTATAMSIPFESAEKWQIIVPIAMPIGELSENTSIEIAGLCNVSIKRTNWVLNHESYARSNTDDKPGAC